MATIAAAAVGLVSTPLGWPAAGGPVGWPAFARAADDSSTSVRGEVGAEYDSNVHRTEQVRGVASAEAQGSPLGRAFVGLASAGRLGDGSQDLAFSLLGGAKVFERWSARSENVLVVESAGAYRLRLSERTLLSAGWQYYEAIQAGTPAERELTGEARDFRSLAPSLRLGRSVGTSGQLDLALGWRDFTYKPNRGYDFRAPVVAAEYRLQSESADGAADWELAVAAGIELRRFTGVRLVRSPTDCAPGACTPALDPAGVTHADQFSVGRVDLTRTGRLLLGIGYALQWNRSNSYTESVIRHVATARATASLPLDLYLAARAEFVFASYPERVVLGAGPTASALTSIEDENRSQLRVELSRTLAAPWRVVARYNLNVNAFGQSVVEYQRQTVTLSLAFTTRN